MKNAVDSQSISRFFTFSEERALRNDHAIRQFEQALQDQTTDIHLAVSDLREAITHMGIWDSFCDRFSFRDHRKSELLERVVQLIVIGKGTEAQLPSHAIEAALSLQRGLTLREVAGSAVSFLVQNAKDGLDIERQMSFEPADLPCTLVNDSARSGVIRIGDAVPEIGGLCIPCDLPDTGRMRSLWTERQFRQPELPADIVAHIAGFLRPTDAAALSRASSRVQCHGDIQRLLATEKLALIERGEAACARLESRIDMVSVLNTNPDVQAFRQESRTNERFLIHRVCKWLVRDNRPYVQKEALSDAFRFNDLALVAEMLEREIGTQFLTVDFLGLVARSNCPAALFMQLCTKARLLAPRCRYSPIVVAAEYGRADLIRALLEAGEDPQGRERDRRRETPLMLAARHGNPEAVRELLVHNKGINVVAPYGKATALTNAIEGGHVEVVRMLLDAGADPNLRISDGFVRDGWTPLVVAVMSGEGAVVAMLLARGASLTPTMSGAALMHFAAEHGYDTVVEALLDAGVSPNQRAVNGESPLIAAIDGGDEDTVRLLLARGADPSQTNHTGDTPLLQAIRSERYEMARLLLAAGADPNQTDGNGKTPMNAAIRKSANEVISSLLSLGVQAPWSSYYKGERR